MPTLPYRKNLWRRSPYSFHFCFVVMGSSLDVNAEILIPKFDSHWRPFCNCHLEEFVKCRIWELSEFCQMKMIEYFSNDNGKKLFRILKFGDFERPFFPFPTLGICFFKSLQSNQGYLKFPTH